MIFHEDTNIRLVEMPSCTLHSETSTGHDLGSGVEVFCSVFGGNLTYPPKVRTLDDTAHFLRRTKMVTGRSWKYRSEMALIINQPVAD